MRLAIFSERTYEKWPSCHVIYEWEDVLQKELNCKIISLHLLGKIGRKFRSIKIKLFPDKYKIFSKGENEKCYLIWVIDASLYRMYTYKNVIPVFLDFSEDMIPEIVNATKSIPVYWVTCLSVYQKLKKNGSNNVRYMPLSISDKYLCNTVPEKSIDVIQFGRKNKILHEWMLKYIELHPTVEYVYQTEGGSLTYYSTTRGEIGRFDDRESYMRLLAASKVSVISSPNVDGERNFGKDIDFFTPRFYESAAVYSHLLGRYTENEEAEILGINNICCNIKTWNQFDYELTKALETPCTENIDKYARFLDENKTSSRAKELLEVLHNSYVLDL